MAQRPRSVSPEATNEVVAAESAAGRRRRRRQDRLIKYGFLSPGLLIVVVLLAAPLLLGLASTFTNWQLFGRPVEFVGLKNWRSLPDGLAFDTGRVTLIFVGLTVPVSLVLSLTVSMAMEQIARGKILFQTLFLIPLVVSPVALSIVARMLLSPRVSPVNAVIEAVGVDAPGWLTDRWPAMFAIVLVDVWASSAFMILLISAGLKALPDEVYEAAAIDGATGWGAFWHVTLPLMSPVLLVVTLLKTIQAFQVADIPLTLTGGGPGIATEPLSLTVYNTGVSSGDLSLASTQAYFLFLLMSVGMLLVLVLFRPLTRKMAVR